MADPHDVLFVIDPPENFDARADSTVVMVTEALRRGHRPWGVTLEGLMLRGGDAWSEARPLTADADANIAFGPKTQPRPLSSFSVVLMRKDPPFDQAYLTATWLLDYAHTPVFNAPAGLRDLNEKLAIMAFPDLVPKTYVSSSEAELRRLIDEHGGQMIVKPVFGFGGRGILLARSEDRNLGSLLELITEDGARPTVAQEYVPAARQGDKRILMVDGEPVGVVLRVPAQGELRNNFHTGGKPAATKLDDRDRAICSRVGPLLREKGQFFVGLDVIGGLLTEINVTSPTGMQEVNRLEGLQGDETMQAVFWAGLESKLGLPRGS